MADMGWVVEAVVAILVVAVIILLVRRRTTSGAQSGTTASAPKASAPVPPASPLVTAAPPLPIPPVEEIPPQTVAAEPTPPVDPVTAVDPVLPFETEAVPPVPSPEPVAVPSDNAADNLLRLKGVGPKLAALLNGEGIHRYAQIAEWTDADLAAIDAKLGSFAGRPKRDNWVDQARLLAAGDVAGYEAKYGKL